MAAAPDLFPATYEASRSRFREALGLLSERWPGARLGSHPLEGPEDLTIDWIEAKPGSRAERLLLFTTGEHGIEGYVGSAVLRLLIDEFLPALNPSTTGLFLLHAINPWGMKHRRRTNANNIDLNRNFLSPTTAFDPASNPSYASLHPLLNPTGPVRELTRSRWAFYARLLAKAFRLGAGPLREATLVGQYRFPRGIYYGGDRLQEETLTLRSLFETQLGLYDRTLHLDVHTGYGPPLSMMVVTSALETRASVALARAFAYPHVVKATSSEFYRIQGDMIDCIYTLAREQHPGKPFFGASFEYGTLGESLSAELRSLHIMVLENQLHYYGAISPSLEGRIRHEFNALFAPEDLPWRLRAIESARSAIRGILTAEGFL
jgi:hypothetical protein